MSKVNIGRMVSNPFSYKYEGDLIRPPAEAGSIILQPTIGCPNSSCTFCGAYADVKFRKRSPEEFRAHARWVASHEGTDGSRVFFADGDTMVLPTKSILELINETRKIFTGARRFSLYSGAAGILTKSSDDLTELKNAGLNTIYIGLESGSEKILSKRKKACTAKEMISAVKSAQSAGIRVSVMVLLGLGGTDGSEEHALKTAEVLNSMQPRLLSFLTLILVPGTPLWKDHQDGRFQILTPVQTLKELRMIVENLELERTVFNANHASTFFPLEGALPRDKNRFIHELDSAITGKFNLVPEFLRGL